MRLALQEFERVRSADEPSALQRARALPRFAARRKQIPHVNPESGRDGLDRTAAPAAQKNGPVVGDADAERRLVLSSVRGTDCAPTLATTRTRIVEAREHEV